MGLALCTLICGFVSVSMLNVLPNCQSLSCNCH